MKYYTGIGSRKTPEYILKVMTEYARKLDISGYTLRSGGAKGADTAFSNGSTNKQIFLPWKGFNNLESEYTSASDKAFEIASKVHPAWNRCSRGAKLLHARNIHQVLGPNLKENSDFVICWTEGGKDIGGTATAIKLAKHLGIKVYNLGNDLSMDEFELFMETV